MNTGKLVAGMALRFAAGLALVGGFLFGLDRFGILDVACLILRSVPVMD